jgi:Na+/melibiose symporter-like transporter
MFSFAGNFAGRYTNPYAMVNFMTQDIHERQRLWSIGPVITGLFRSILGIIIPIVIVRGSFMGIPLGGFRSLWAYQVLISAMAIISLITALPILLVKENLIEQKIDRPKVKFFAGAKKVFQNKYLWIQNISGFLGGFGFMVANLVNFWLIYIMRSAWMIGIIGGIISFASVVPNLITPWLIKKIEKRNLFLMGRIALVIMTLVQFFAFLGGQFIIFVLVMFLRNIFDTVVKGIGNSLFGDIMDYHHWKFGERADATAGIFGWFLNPIFAVMGFIAPWVYRQYGLTNDWSIFYDREVFDNLFIVSFIATLISGVLSVIPFFFYDLTADKHKFYVNELRERTRQADLEALKQRIREGDTADIDADVLGDLQNQIAEEGV